MLVECKKCINTNENPSITFNGKGLCNVCERYLTNFNKDQLNQELKFLRSFIANKKYDAMVGISGGKDSTAVLYTVKEMGFTPLAFSFEIGYTTKDMFIRAREIARKIGVGYEVIDVRQHVGEKDRESFVKMAELYDEKEGNELRDKFRNLYEEGRKHYSTKSDIAFPFVRPCQICRKIAIKSYYAEAQKRGIQVVIIGINEWTGLSGNSYSAIRKLQPLKSKPPVYIVHLPFLLQRKLADTKKILSKIGWQKPVSEKYVDTGSGTCYLARACEAKAARLLGFNMDSTRLAREVTIGFLTKKEAKSALSKIRRSEKSVKTVLKEAGLI